MKLQTCTLLTPKVCSNTSMHCNLLYVAVLDFKWPSYDEILSISRLQGCVVVHSHDGVEIGNLEFVLIFSV